MNKIYRYLPFNLNTLRFLVTGHLYLASPSNLNDPFESEFEFKKLNNLPDQAFLEKIFSGRKIKVKDVNEVNFYIHLKKLLHDILNEEYGITCFSETKNNTLMWSHYADSHKGICLEFDSDKLMQSEVIRHLGLKLENVKILNEVPSVEIIVTSDGFAFKEQEDISLWKFSHWLHEKEIRLHGNLSNYRNADGSVKRTMPFNWDSLTAIILGEKFPDEDEHLIAHLTSNHQQLKKLKWFRAKKDLKQAHMQIEEFGGFGIVKSIDFQVGLNG
jgi:hypothetical protein